MELLVKCLYVAVLFFCFYLQGSEQSRGGWGEWGQYSGCSKTCGMGLKTRIRQWLLPEGEPPLKEPFTNTEEYTCITQPCPQNGSWSGWGMWAECEVACGGGSRQRHRDCNNPPPENGGADCEGKKFDQETCNEEPCPPLPANFDMSQCDADRNFTCSNAKMCIDIRQKCDDKVQCSDGSDEMNCWRKSYKTGHVYFSNSLAYHAVSVYSVWTVLLSSLYIHIFTV